MNRERQSPANQVPGERRPSRQHDGARAASTSLYLILTLLIVFFARPAGASPTCSALFDQPAWASRVRLETSYPRFRGTLEKLNANIFKSRELVGRWKQMSPAVTAFEIRRYDPWLRRSLEQIAERMSNVDLFASYIQKLALEAAGEMEHRHGKEDVQKLRAGHLSRSAVLKVLVRRFKLHGNARFSVVKDYNDDAFILALQRGPFFDKAFIDNAHGMDTHALQMDYISDILWEETNGNPRAFWNFLASAEGIHFWKQLFDVGGPTLACPEYLKGLVGEELPLR